MSFMSTSLVVTALFSALNTADANLYSLNVKLRPVTPITISLNVTEYGSQRTILSLNRSIENALEMDIDYESIIDSIEIFVIDPSNNVTDNRSIFLGKGVASFVDLPYLTIEITRNCQKNVYGFACKRHCVAPNGLSNYYCDNKGLKRCREGWTGQRCNRRINGSLKTTQSSTTVIPSTVTAPCDQATIPVAISIVIVVIVIGFMMVFVLIIFRYLLSILTVLSTELIAKEVRDAEHPDDHNLFEKAIFHCNSEQHFKTVVDEVTSESADDDGSVTSNAERTYFELIV